MTFCSIELKCLYSYNIRVLAQFIKKTEFWMISKGLLKEVIAHKIGI